MNTLKLLTYNIHKGFSLGNRRFVLGQIREQIRDIRPDVVFLQEVAAFSQQEDQLEYLADQVWKYAAYGRNALYPKGHHGNAILSRHPIQNSFNLDLTTNRLEKRGMLHATIELPGGILHLLNTHLSLTEFARNKQILKICSYVESSTTQDEAMLVAGDLNDWSNQLTHPLKERLSLNEVFQKLQGRVAKTYPSLFPLLPLDRIYFRGSELVTAQALSGEKWNKLSDHLPLLATFKL